jgi:hypothetical protein
MHTRPTFRTPLRCGACPASGAPDRARAARHGASARSPSRRLRPQMESEDVCWICLDEADEKRPIFSPCKCPRKVHPQCLARWQLQQAGRHEEKFCR